MYYVGEEGKLPPFSCWGTHREKREREREPAAAQRQQEKQRRRQEVEEKEEKEGAGQGRAGQNVEANYLFGGGTVHGPGTCGGLLSIRSG